VLGGDLLTAFNWTSNKQHNGERRVHNLRIELSERCKAYPGQMKVVVSKVGTNESQPFHVDDAVSLAAAAKQLFQCDGFLWNAKREVVLSASYQLTEGEVFTWGPEPGPAPPGAAGVQAGGAATGASVAHPRGVQGIGTVCASGNVIPAWQHQQHQHQQRGATLRQRHVGSRAGVHA